jgi:hypothetical protein
MKKQTPNECRSGSPWARINILFLKYRVLRDEDSKNKLCNEVANTYTLEFVKAKRPDWSDRWCDEVYSRLYLKFVNVLNNPDCVKKGKDGVYKLTAYMSSALYSIAADVYRHYSKEDEVAKVAQFKASERKNQQELKFADIVWKAAMNMPGIRGDVFRLYMSGIRSRTDECVVNKAYTLDGIASRLGLTQTCVATHIRRAKMSLERELRPLGLKMGALSQQRHYR